MATAANVAINPRFRITFRLVACQRHQPSLGLRRNCRLLAWSGPVIECRQWAIGQRPLDAALHRLTGNSGLWRCAIGPAAATIHVGPCTIFAPGWEAPIDSMFSETLIVLTLQRPV